MGVRIHLRQMNSPVTFPQGTRKSDYYSQKNRSDNSQSITESGHFHPTSESENFHSINESEDGILAKKTKQFINYY